MVVMATVAVERLVPRDPRADVDALDGADRFELLEDPVDRGPGDAPRARGEPGLDLERRQRAALAGHQLKQLAPRAAGAVAGVGKPVGDPVGPAAGVVVDVGHLGERLCRNPLRGEVLDAPAAGPEDPAEHVAPRAHRADEEPDRIVGLVGAGDRRADSASARPGRSQSARAAAGAPTIRLNTRSVPTTGTVSAVASATTSRKQSSTTPTRTPRARADSGRAVPSRSGR